MKFGILGPTECSDDRRSISLGAAKQRGLLSVLLLHAGKSVRVDTLMEHLWSGGGTIDRRKILYSMVSRLRAILARSGVPHSLTRVGNAYRLEIALASVDVHQFRALVERARAASADGRAADAVADLRRAIELWRGEPMPELQGAAAEHLRRQLAEGLLEAQKLLASEQLRIGQHHAALAELESLVHQPDVDLGTARLWISALCAAGRVDDAQRFLTAFRKRYRREHHADPEIDLDAIRAQPPHVIGPRPHQLPYVVPDFVGRADLLAELDRLATNDPGGSKVVAITGMPGVGKTTLAVHWSRRNLDLFSDGVLFLDAGAFGPGVPIDPKEASARFLQALGVPPDRIPEDADGRRHRYNEMLRGRRMLVVIDNAADSDQVRPLIPSAPTCLTIITSRRRLRGLTVREGVHHLVGYPLADDEAGALLARIIGEQRVAAEPAAVGRLAEIARGLPLALRILGVRVTEHPRAAISELVGELQERLLWARAEEDDLTTVFNWSLRALPPETAAVFRRLALHPGARISLEAAAVLAGTDIVEAESTLDLLARMNLLEHETARHYEFHDLLRQHAAATGENEDSADDIAAARLAITTWFLRSATNAAAILAPQLPPVPDLPPAPAHVMEFESENAAFAWCQSERENLATAARLAARHGLHRLAWQIPAAVHDVFTRTGRYSDLILMNSLGADSARLDRHEYGEMVALSNLGYSYCGVHKYDLAIAPLTAARALAAKSGDRATESVCWHNTGGAHLGMGDTGRAIEIFQNVQSMCRRLGLAYGESATLHRMGEAYRKEKRPDLALAAYSQALRLRERIGAEREQGQSHTELSRFYLELGELRLAERHCAEAQAIHDRIQDAAGARDSLIARADIARAAGSESAVALARAAVAASVDLGDSYREVHARTVLAEALAAAGSSEEAARVRAEALEIATQLAGPDAVPLRERLGLAAFPAASTVLP